jgi:hypothetical protein
MFTLILALTITTQPLPAPHVRATEPRTRALIEAGISGSATFRHLIATLDQSDVIVYVEPKLTRPALSGYLSHTIVARGRHRYLRVAVDVAGAKRRRVAVLAHELQHAVEVAEAQARDAATLKYLFSQLAVPFGCNTSTCFETQAAQDVERIVDDELAGRVGAARRRLADSGFAREP